MGVIFNFTPCGATKSVGPTQAQVDSAYINTPLEGKVTVINGAQKFIVPATGQYKITMTGASGGNTNSDGKTGTGGLGAKVETTMNFNQGDVLLLWVGQQGWTTNTNDRPTQGGFGGGMGGGCNSTDSSMSAGTGGGASAIARDAATYTSRFLIASGGGGAGWSGINGGGGGIATGIDGINDSRWSNGNGKGATQSAGGVNGSGGSTATSGILGDGGRGQGSSAGGGGGGGGLYGGGGAWIEGGGGGSSLIGGTDPVGTPATQSGDGFITMELTASNKYLVLDDNDVKAWDSVNSIYTKVADAPVTLDLMKQYGVTALPLNRTGLISATPTIYTWSQIGVTKYPTNAIITGLPKPQTIVMNYDISFGDAYIKSMNKITYSGNIDAASIVTFAFSGDGGAHWYTLQNGSWVAVDITDPVAFSTTGIKPADLANITSDQWMAIFSQKLMRVAIYMELPSVSAKAVLQNLLASYNV